MSTDEKISKVQAFLASKGIVSQAPPAPKPLLQYKPTYAVLAPNPPEPEYSFDVYCDSDNELVGQALIQADNKHVVLYLPDGWLVKQLRNANITAFIEAGELKKEINQVAALGFDPMNQRTCVWYTPGQDHVNSFGAEVGSNYEFDRPQGLSTCSNKNIVADSGVPNPPCEAEARMAICPYYQKEDWTIERKAEVTVANGDVYTVHVETVRYGFGFRKFRIYSQTTGDAVMVAELNSVELKDDLYTQLDELFAGVIQDFEPTNVELLDVTVALEGPEEKYVDYVLAK